jgi:hypothetical protein
MHISADLIKGLEAAEPGEFVSFQFGSEDVLAIMLRKFDIGRPSGCMRHLPRKLRGADL